MNAPESKAGEAASLAARFGAWIYEGIILFGLIWFSDYAFDALTQSKHALVLRHARMVFLFLVLGLYFVYFWHKGQTLPMKTWKIRLRSNNSHRAGQAASWGQCVLRYVLSWLWFLPPLAAIAPFSLSGGESAVIVLGWVAVWALLSRFHPTRQFWHDALAGTRLVHYEIPKK